MKAFKSLLVLFVVLFSANTIHAQVGIGTINPLGALDITSDTDGLVIPRVALTGTNLPAPLTAPTVSELVYNMVTVGGPNGVTPGFYYWSAAATWVRFGGSGWLIEGNSGTNATNNFVGTLDNVDVAFRRNNLAAGRIGATSTSFGVGALSSLTAGTRRDNVAFGTNALAATVNGVENVAIGGNALSGATSSGADASWGYANTAVGFNALTNIRPGNDNVALGYQALQNNVGDISGGGSGTIGIGYRAGLNNTGARFIAIGYSAGLGNKAPNNIAIGTNALDAHIRDASVQNIAIGTDAMGTGSNNTTTVSDNVAIGHQAGQSIRSINNVAIGSNAGVAIAAGESNVAIGSGVMVQGGGSAFNVAIGTEAMFNYSVSGGSNVSIGYRANRLNGTGNQSIAIGYEASTANLQNAIAIGYQVTAPASNSIRLGNTSITVAQAAVPWSLISDRRYKSNIIDSPLGLDFIKTLRPVSYFKKKDENKKTEYGFIAQEVETALNNVGDTNNGIVYIDSEGNYSLRYNDFIPMTVKAVQEQQVLIVTLQKDNEELKATNEAILKRLDALEKRQ